MNNKIISLGALTMILLFFTGSAAWGHVTPNVKLMTTRETVASLLPEGNLFLKEVQLTPEQVEQLKTGGYWTSQNTHYKFYLSRDRNNHLLRAMVFVTEFTRHGPVVLAVAFDPRGTIVDARVTDIQMEPLEWMGPLIRGNYMREFVGKNGNMPVSLAPKWTTGTTKMTQAFALIVARAVKRSAQLFDTVFKQKQ